MVGCRCAVCSSADGRDKRWRTSAMIQADGVRLVVDTGPDFRAQMLAHSVERLDGVLYTHAHRDHTAGLDELRIFNYLQRAAIEVWCDKTTDGALHTEFDYVFLPEEERYPGVPQINVHRVEEPWSPFRIKGLQVEPLRVLHGALPILGYRFGDRGQVVYLTDCSAVPEAVLSKIRGCEVLVVNAVRREPHASHFSLDQALDLIQQSGAQRGYLTHVSHQLGLYAQVERELPSHVVLGYDGLEINC